MKTLFLDCGMGAAGDMLTAALLELLPDREEFLKELNGLGIPGVRFFAEEAVKCGIRGTRVRVTVNGGEEAEAGWEQDCPHSHDHDHIHDHGHEHPHDHGHDHSHSGMEDIRRIVAGLPVSEGVRGDVLAVYSRIAQAESQVHGVPVSQIHFHEVGAMDAVADITAVCLLMERLAPEQVVVSPIHVGSGCVRCAHGILPVPAPATAYLLRDVPIYGGEIRGELCTPTGAALLRHFATSFGALPVMRTEAVGYGMGKKDFPAANCLRAMLGQTGDAGGTVTELSCNLDDMTPEALGFAQERLFAAGALEVYTLSAQMKKSRPGVELRVLCREADREKMIGLIFKHTTTLGIREQLSRRHTLSRREETVATEFGEVRKKVSWGYGIEREKYEYEDIARIARERGMSVSDVAARLREPQRP